MKMQQEDFDFNSMNATIANLNPEEDRIQDCQDHKIQQETINLNGDNTVNLKEEEYRTIFSQDHVCNLRSGQFITNMVMDQKALICRKRLFLWGFKHAKPHLKLLPSTLQHSYKLYDLFFHTYKPLYKNVNEAQFDYMVCLFISSKYNQIYPPTIYQFVALSKHQINTRQIIERELVIWMKIEGRLAISLSSEWYGLLFGKKEMPIWAYYCLPRVKWNITSENFSRKVGELQIKLVENPQLCTNIVQTIELAVAIIQGKTLLGKHYISPDDFGVSIEMCPLQCKEDLKKGSKEKPLKQKQRIKLSQQIVNKIKNE